MHSIYTSVKRIMHDCFGGETIYIIMLLATLRLKYALDLGLGLVRVLKKEGEVMGDAIRWRDGYPCKLLCLVGGEERRDAFYSTFSLSSCVLLIWRPGFLSF